MVVKVDLLPVGTPSPVAIDTLARELDAFGFEVDEAGGVPLPEHLYDRTRRQYEAEAMLTALRGRRHGGDILLAVTDADLFVPALNFVFGIGSPDDGHAIISLHRLGAANESLFRERALKEAVHELGHALGLPHCHTSGCIMQFSNSLAIGVFLSVKNAWPGLGCPKRVPPPSEPTTDPG